MSWLELWLLFLQNGIDFELELEEDFHFLLLLEVQLQNQTLCEFQKRSLPLEGLLHRILPKVLKCKIREKFKDSNANFDESGSLLDYPK